jgi:hypothetical protein
MTPDPKNAELEGVIAMGALVEYQPGAVVSRTLVKKPAGTVTAFAFDAGEGLSEHTAPYDALGLTIPPSPPGGRPRPSAFFHQGSK